MGQKILTNFLFWPGNRMMKFRLMKSRIMKYRITYWIILSFKKTLLFQYFFLIFRDFLEMFNRGQDNTELLTKDTIIDDAKILSEQKESRLNKDLSQLKKDLTRIDSNRLEKGAEMKATATTKSNAKDDMKVHSDQRRLQSQNIGRPLTLCRGKIFVMQHLFFLSY